MNTVLMTAAGRTGATRRPAPVLPWPMLLWAVVLLATMLSFYVHLLNEQVQRGERLRAGQRAAAVVTKAPAPAEPVAAQLPAAALVRVASR